MMMMMMMKCATANAVFDQNPRTDADSKFLDPHLSASCTTMT